MKVGIAIQCTICYKRKSPVGRAAPLEIVSGLCDSECFGYREYPYPGCLWPGESEVDFGYPIGIDGWKEVE